MTLDQLNSYKVLICDAYQNYVTSIVNTTKIRKINVKHEFDTKIWILTKCINIISCFNYDNNNYFNQSDMLQWQDIMNDIMKTKLYIDFKIE